MIHYELDIVKSLNGLVAPYDKVDGDILRTVSRIEFIEADEEYEEIHLRFPADHRIINPDFFTAFMQESFNRHKGKENFLKRYKLVTNKKSKEFFEHIDFLLTELDKNMKGE